MPGTTYRVMGRSGLIGRGLDREAADALAEVSGCTVEFETGGPTDPDQAETPGCLFDPAYAGESWEED